MGKKKWLTKAMDCPVCGEYRFPALDEEDAENGLTPESLDCPFCGWKYDPRQLKDPRIRTERNRISLNLRRKRFLEHIRKNPNYVYIRHKRRPPKVPHPCPVCGLYEFEYENCHDICHYCGWEDNGFESFPDEVPFENGLSFNETKRRFERERAKDPSYMWEKDPDRMRRD